MLCCSIYTSMQGRDQKRQADSKLQLQLSFGSPPSNDSRLKLDFPSQLTTLDNGANNLGSFNANLSMAAAASAGFGPNLNTANGSTNPFGNLSLADPRVRSTSRTATALAADE